MRSHTYISSLGVLTEWEPYTEQFSLDRTIQSNKIFKKAHHNITMGMDLDELERKCREYEAGSKELHEWAVQHGATELAESTKRSGSGWDEVYKKIEEYRNST